MILFSVFATAPMYVVGARSNLFQGIPIMNQQSTPYIAYLLRLWQESHNGQTVWRASLEDAQSGKLHGFGSLAALFAFLESQATQRDRQEDSS